MIKEKITNIDIEKIFGNKDQKVSYLKKLKVKKNIDLDISKSKNQLNKLIIDTWDYEISKTIIRDLYFETEKYLSSKNSKNKIDKAIQSWNKLLLGDLEWPFQPMKFDQKVAHINRMNILEKSKDKMLSKEVIKFRRIKDINTLRNDYIEFLIINNNDKIVPTLKHSRGLDFYIHGKPFDQKVSKGVGEKFKETYGEDYRNIALQNPKYVAKSLYEHQDLDRFDEDPRLYIVYLDKNISSQQIEKLLTNIKFEEPFPIEFSYDNKYGVTKHNTECYVILLYNENPH